MNSHNHTHESYLVHPSVSIDAGSLENVDLRSVTLEAEEVDERIPRPVLFMKIVELMMTCGCLAAYASACNVEENSTKIGLSWATFGSQLIIITFMLLGYVVGETTPRLNVGQNAAGGILFLASGASSIETWWDYQERMLGIITDPEENFNADMLLVTGLLALMNSALLFADTLMAAVLWRIASIRRSSAW